MFFFIFQTSSGVESPVPLTEMPDSCGFSLKRARRDVSLDASYQACHVRQQVSLHVKDDKCTVALQQTNEKWALHDFYYNAFLLFFLPKSPNSVGVIFCHSL